MTKTNFSLAFVTGASSGIGAGICRLLASKGIALLITGREIQRLKALADELSLLVPVEMIAADIAVKEECRRLIDKIYERAPDLIINNAGFGLYGLALTHETSAQKAMIDVNVTGVLELTLEGARTLLSSNKTGVILNVSSIADLLIFPGLAVYAASKAFVTQFSKSLDEEMRPHGIRILASCPGAVATEFRKRASGNMNAKPERHAMSVNFAAEQIWNQIVKGQQVYRFDWKTRIAAFFARNIFPQKLVSKILKHRIDSYQPKPESKIT